MDLGELLPQRLCDEKAHKVNSRTYMKVNVCEFTNDVKIYSMENREKEVRDSMFQFCAVQDQSPATSLLMLA